MKQTKSNLITKIYNVISAVVLALFLLLLLFVIYSRATTKYVAIFGYTFSVVASPSMDGQEAPVIKQGDFIVVKTKNIQSVKMHDTVLYKTNLPENTAQGIERILHKVINISQDENDKTCLTTKGTANTRADDEKVYQIIGVYVGKSTLLGKIIVFLKNPINVVFIAILFTTLYISVKLLINIIVTIKQSE